MSEPDLRWARWSGRLAGLAAVAGPEATPPGTGCPSAGVTSGGRRRRAAPAPDATAVGNVDGLREQTTGAGMAVAAVAEGARWPGAAAWSAGRRARRCAPTRPWGARASPRARPPRRRRGARRPNTPARGSLRVRRTRGAPRKSSPGRSRRAARSSPHAGRSFRKQQRPSWSWSKASAAGGVPGGGLLQPGCTGWVEPARASEIRSTLSAA